MEPESLRRVPLFAVLSPSRLQELATRLPLGDVVAGEVVAHGGHSANQLVVLESGTLTAAQDTRDGVRVRLSTVTGQCVVDKAATLGAGTHTATWTAATPCRVARLPAADLRRLIDQEPALRDHVLRHLSGEVDRQRRSRVRSASSSSLAQVAEWLAAAQRTAGGTVHLIGGQQGLGEELGLSRVTVNRALRALVAAGAIRVRPGEVDLVDAHGVALAGDGT